MKEQWREKFDMLDMMNCDCEHCVETYKADIIDFVTSLLDQQKKDLIEQILKDAPVTFDHICRFNDPPQVCDCYDLCNSQWRELLNKLK